ncbi:MAG: hypothetical protein GXO80_00130 [Chlorobi bacterium]|nr:hypothetical protein [Chlorobiota bacterium]
MPLTAAKGDNNARMLKTKPIIANALPLVCLYKPETAKMKLFKAYFSILGLLSYFFQNSSAWRLLILHYFLL